MTRQLTIVIVTVGSVSNLSRCLSSLGSQIFAEFDVVVVSNARHDAVQEVILHSPLADKTRLVRSEVNRGYGAACNLGAQHSDAPFLIFLNDDVYFGEDWLSELYKSLCSETNTLFQSRIFHELTEQTRNGNPCDIYGAAGITFYKGCGTGEFYASGASLAMSKKIFDALGGFDEALFLYHDDVDLSWRARLMGFGISSAESALCYHSGASSSTTIPHTTKFYLTQRNRIRLLIKNYSAWRIVSRLPVACIMIVLGSIFLTLRTRKVGYTISAINALTWNITGLGNTLIDRYKIQCRRIKDDEAVEKAMHKYSMDICVLKHYIAFPAG